MKYMNLFNITARFRMNHASLKQRSSLFLLVVFIGLISVSCGKKGPLYLSTKEAQTINKPQDEQVKPKAKKANVKEQAETPADSAK